MSTRLNFLSRGNTRTPSCRPQLRKNRTPVHSDHRRVHDFPHFGLFPCRVCTQNAVRGRFAAIAAARGKRIPGLSRGLDSKSAIVRAQMQHTPPFEGAYVALQYVGGRFCNCGFGSGYIHLRTTQQPKICANTRVFALLLAQTGEICVKWPSIHIFWPKARKSVQNSLFYTDYGTSPE